MSPFDSDIDKQISGFHQKIKELEELKVLQAQKLESIKEFQDMVQRLTNQYGVEEGELYVARSMQILEWIKGMSRMSDKPSIYSNLKDHFEKVARLEERKGAKSGKISSKKSINTEPKLIVGTYRNPATGENIEKIKRTPKGLMEWVMDHGFETVSSWKV